MRSRKVHAVLLAGLLLGATAARGDEFLYTVQAGDNPWAISERLLVDMSYWPRLQRHNQILADRRIPPGTVLRIPREWLRLQATHLRLVAVAGKVQLKRSGNWAAARPDIDMKAGDSLSTSTDASATLAIDDTGTILLRPSTEIRLVEAQHEKGRGPRVRIELVQGGLENVVHTLRQNGGELEVTTPTATTSVRGTVFRVSVDERSTRAEVLDGTVNLGNPLGQTDVTAGRGSLAAADVAPLEPEALLPAPELGHLPKRQEAWPLQGRLGHAGRYRMQLLAGGPREAMLAEAEGTSLANLAELPDGRYRLRVRAIADNGLEGLTAEQEIEVDAQPAAPRLPADVPPGPMGSPVLSWDAPRPGLRYRLQVHPLPPDGEPFGLAPAVLDRLLDQPRHPVSDLPPGRYTWRIASLDGNDQGPWSRPALMEVASQVPRWSDTTLDGTLHLRWHTAAPTDAPLRLQIALDADFALPVFDEIVHGRDVVLPRPRAGRYHLRLTLLDGPLAWSETQTLDVGHRLFGLR